MSEAQYRDPWRFQNLDFYYAQRKIQAFKNE